jgi:hypothetical protein
MADGNCFNLSVINLKTAVEPAHTPFALSPVEGWMGFGRAHGHLLGEPADFFPIRCYDLGHYSAYFPLALKQ